MERSARFVFATFLISSTLFILGCQNSMQGIPFNGNSSGVADLTLPPSVDPGVELDKIQLETMMAEQSLQEAIATIEDLENDDGSLRIPLMVTSSTGQIETQGIKDGLKKIFGKVLGAIERVRMVFDQARAKIEDAKSKLDPNNPAHQHLIAKLDQMLAKIDQLEQKIDMVFQTLASKVDIILDKIEQLKAKLNPLENPAHILLEIALTVVQTVIIDFRNDLLAQVGA